jgi:hypothetical protein
MTNVREVCAAHMRTPVEVVSYGKGWSSGQSRQRKSPGVTS